MSYGAVGEGGEEVPPWHPEYLSAHAALFAEPSLDAETAIELADLHTATRESALAKHRFFLDTDDYGDRVVSGVELEYQGENKRTTLMTIWSTNAISVSNIGPDKRWNVSDYYRSPKGVVRYDRGPSASLPHRGQIPLSREWQMVREAQLQATSARRHEGRTGHNFHVVNPEEFFQLVDMIADARPRRVPFEQLERVFLRRRDSRKDDRPTEEDSIRGADDLSTYVHAFLVMKELQPDGRRAVSVTLTTIDEKGKLLLTRIGTRKDALGEALPFASITGNWDLNEKMRSRFTPIVGSRGYLKAIMNLDYAVYNGSLRIIRNFSLEDMQGKVVHAYRPQLVRGDQLEARLVRNFAASPEFNMRRRRTQTV